MGPQQVRKKTDGRLLKHDSPYEAFSNNENVLKAQNNILRVPWAHAWAQKSLENQKKRKIDTEIST